MPYDISFQTFGSTVDTAWLSDSGGVVAIERRYGCSGSIHLDSVDEVYYDHDGKLEFAKHIGVERARRCDGSCWGKRDAGWFLAQTAWLW